VYPLILSIVVPLEFIRIVPYPIVDQEEKEKGVATVNSSSSSSSCPSAAAFQEDNTRSRMDGWMKFFPLEIWYEHQQQLKAAATTALVHSDKICS
jgi:hypothetical protein